MRRLIGVVTAAVVVSGLSVPARAADAGEVNAVLDRAIQALGGKDRLAQVKVATWRTKGTLSFGGNDSEFTSLTTVEGLDHVRQEFEGDFGGNTVKGVTVLAGDKGWRKFGDNVMELSADAVAAQKRTLYLQVIPMTVLPLRDKGFKAEADGEEMVGGKPAVRVKVTPPDGKDFTLSFDKASGLPVKLVARVPGFMGGEFTQETTYADYKDFQGVKKATKIESKRDGEKFMDQQVLDFKVLDKVGPETFAEPK